MSTRTNASSEPGEPLTTPVRSVPGTRTGQTEDDRFDRLIYGRVRLGILSALAINELLTFNDLKALFAVTDGNLGAHARKLEDAGYISCRKTFEERRPRTEYRLTPTGRKALERYLQHIEAVIRATRRA
jgi:DNA-binding MarR family transcriptional regulator